MIFVTVGTHEQQFNRLVDYMDKWAGDHDEDVIIQTGFTKIRPVHCEYHEFYRYEDMERMIRKARIVITHGGPSSFMTALLNGKNPIVVPRKHSLREHVNDHQLLFCTEFEQRQKNIIVVEDINRLGDVIERYDEMVSGMTNRQFVSHNKEFCDAFSKIVDGICK